MLVMAAPAAPACSCVGPIGVRTVEGVVRDERAIDATLGEHEYDVLSGADVLRVRVATYELGAAVTSSCALAPRLVVGARYRIGAYPGSDDDGAPVLFANACGGAVELLAAAPDDDTVDEDDDGGGARRVPIAVAGVLAAVAGTAAVLSRTRSR